MHPDLKAFAPHFFTVINKFNLVELTQLNKDELAEMLAEYFATAARRGENEQQFLERLGNLFLIGEAVYDRKGFYPDFPGDDNGAFWAEVAQALLDETRDQLKAQGYLTGGA
jgi:hypothetical protein